MSEPEPIPDPTRAGIVLAVAIGIVGVTYGVLARAAGVGGWQAQAMSVFVFTGASQFAAVSILGAGGNPLAAFGTATLLAARNMLYGPVVARWFGGSLAARLGLAQLVIDETTGVGAAQPNAARARRGFLVTGIATGIAWNVGTAVGLLLGERIGDPSRWGLDAAFPASYLALLAPMVRDARGRLTAATAVTVALVTTPLLPVGVPILVAALVVVPIALAPVNRART